MRTDQPMSNTMRTQNAITYKVSEYLKKEGYEINLDVKIRGRVVDIVATKEGKITAIEVKGDSGDLQLGIEQALHQKNSADSSYLAIPNERSSKSIISSCQSLGIGLLLVSNQVERVVKSTMNDALPSVRKIFFKEKEKPQKVIATKKPLEVIFRSKSEVPVVGLLISNSSNEFHNNDIARKTGLPSSTITVEMRILQNIGLVLRRTQGNKVFYRINDQHIIFNELKSIFQKFMAIRK